MQIANNTNAKNANAIQMLKTKSNAFLQLLYRKVYSAARDVL